jgi:hypothetical protein
MIKSQDGNVAIGIVLLIVGLAAAAWGYKELSSIRSLFEEGQKTQAQIVKIEEFRTNKAGQQNTYSPVVQWVTESGQKVTAKAQFGSTRSSDYQVGSSLSMIAILRRKDTTYLKMAALPKSASGTMSYSSLERFSCLVAL